MWIWSRREEGSGSAQGGAWSAARSVWGDGFEDCSIATLWYPCTWDTVSDDELLLYMPSLVTETERLARTGIDAARPVQHLRDALCVRILWATIRFSSNAQLATGVDIDAESFVKTTLEQILTTHLDRPLSFASAFERGRTVQGDWFGANQVPRDERRLHRLFRAECDAQVLFALELRAIRAMATLLNAAEMRFLFGRADRADDRRRHDVDPLWHTVLAALHTSFNPAYVFPNLQAQHQLFSVAGWLGWLQRGRPALLPVFIAEYLVDLLERPTSPHTSDLASALLIHYVNDILGAERLLRAARRVVASGRAMMVRTRNARRRRDAAFLVRLLAEFALSEASGGNIAVPAQDIQRNLSDTRGISAHR